MEYFRMHGRIRFWRQIPLLGREALLLSPLLEAMKSSEKALTQRVRCYIAEGFASGELMYGSADEVLLLYQCVIQGSLDSLLLSSDEAVRDGMQARIWSAFEKLLMTSGGM